MLPSLLTTPANNNDKTALVSTWHEGGFSALVIRFLFFQCFFNSSVTEVKAQVNGYHCEVYTVKNELQNCEPAVEVLHHDFTDNNCHIACYDCHGKIWALALGGF